MITSSSKECSDSIFSIPNTLSKSPTCDPWVTFLGLSESHLGGPCAASFKGNKDWLAAEAKAPAGGSRATQSRIHSQLNSRASSMASVFSADDGEDDYLSQLYEPIDIFALLQRLPSFIVPAKLEPRAMPERAITAVGEIRSEQAPSAPRVEETKGPSGGVEDHQRSRVRTVSAESTSSNDRSQSGRRRRSDVGHESRRSHQKAFSHGHGDAFGAPVGGPRRRSDAGHGSGKSPSIGHLGAGGGGLSRRGNDSDASLSSSDAGGFDANRILSKPSVDSSGGEQRSGLRGTSSVRRLPLHRVGSQTEKQVRDGPRCLEDKNLTEMCKHLLEHREKSMVGSRGLIEDKVRTERRKREQFEIFEVTRRLGMLSLISDRLQAWKMEESTYWRKLRFYLEHVTSTYDIQMLQDAFVCSIQAEVVILAIKCVARAKVLISVLNKSDLKLLSGMVECMYFFKDNQELLETGMDMLRSLSAMCANVKSNISKGEYAQAVGEADAIVLLEYVLRNQQDYPAIVESSLSVLQFLCKHDMNNCFRWSSEDQIKLVLELWKRFVEHVPITGQCLELLVRLMDTQMSAIYHVTQLVRYRQIIDTLKIQRKQVNIVKLLCLFILHMNSTFASSSQAKFSNRLFFRITKLLLSRYADDSSMMEVLCGMFYCIINNNSAGHTILKDVNLYDSFLFIIGASFTSESTLLYCIWIFREIAHVLTPQTKSKFLFALRMLKMNQLEKFVISGSIIHREIERVFDTGGVEAQSPHDNHTNRRVSNIDL